ncbi:hypothetical protein [Leucobacter ruminantium]|uniref:Uncharacterized protein n=1 Tax=Leucobacter ruminantium TaxID=1289170 RepID=A0A939M2Q3_9MICO|nr:hypothetical protein [Leucobacter ruminantium]MBO1805890.1 hypothetical protein [Leucobacter ruminantium]
MPICHNCDRFIRSHGIARHRAMHRDRKERVTITLANGTWVWDYTERSGEDDE